MFSTEAPRAPVAMTELRVRDHGDLLATDVLQSLPNVLRL